MSDRPLKKTGLCLVADPDCPTTPTYLVYLEAAGYEAPEIWVCEFASGGKLDRIARHAGLDWALRIQRLERLWNRRGGAADWRERMEADMPVRTGTREARTRIQWLLAHARRVRGTGWKDPQVIRAFTDSEQKHFLFSAGGIVSRDVLSVPGLRMLHLHPGVLPQVRGTDGLLWSLKLRGRPGVTAFWMDPGIDTGRILHRKEFQPPRFASGNRPHRHADWRRMDEALLCHYDPHLRGHTLIELLEKKGAQEWDRLASEEQRREDGTGYRRMPGPERQAILASLFA